MSKVAYQRSAAVLQVSDVLKSRAFYCDKLGFTDSSLWGEPPCFSIVGRDTVTLFLDQSEDKSSAVPVNQNWAAYIYVSDIAALVKQIADNGVVIARGPEMAPYGCREIDIADPDGHLICFAQDMKPSAAGPGL